MSININFKLINVSRVSFYYSYKLIEIKSFYYNISIVIICKKNKAK